MKLFSKYNTTAITLCLITMVLAGNLAFAAAVPFGDSFESYADGPLTDNVAWTGDTNSLVITSNYTYSATTKPMDTEAHTKIVALNTESGAITNPITHTGENIYLDMMIQATRSEDAPADIMTDSSAQLAAYVNTNGKIVVYCAIFNSVWTNQFVELTQSTNIAEGAWIRLTIHMAHTGELAIGVPLFAVQYDGGALLESNYGFANKTDVTSGSPGPWHALASWNVTSPTKINEVSFKGTGFLDDFVVTNGLPLFGAIINKYLITRFFYPANGMGGSVAPVANFEVDEGANATNVFTASNYWSLAYVDDNGASNNPASGADFVITNVMSAHTVTAYFVAQTLTNNVPEWWLATYGTNAVPNDAYALEDDDRDGRSNWEEWLASTDPATSNDFEIIKHYLTNGNAGVVVWVSAAVDPQLPPFNVLRTTNLMDSGGGWTIAGSTNRPIGGGTNEWIDPSPPAAGVPAYYRVSATN